MLVQAAAESGHCPPDITLEQGEFAVGNCLVECACVPVNLWFRLVYELYWTYSTTRITTP